MEPIKKNIVFIVQLPPPIHGVTLMNKYVTESSVLSNQLEIEIIPLNFNNSLENLGRFSIVKGLKLVASLIHIYRRLAFKQTDLVYFTLTPTKSTFYRDLLYVALFNRLHVRHVFHIHGKGIQETLAKHKFLKPLYKFAFSKAEIICLSDRLLYDIAPFTNKRPYILANGIPTRDEGWQTKTGNKSYDILFYSNFSKGKGIIDFILILEKLKRRKIIFTAAIGGTKQDYTKDELTIFIHKLGMGEEIAIIETSNDTQKYDLFNDSRIFVFPTQNEAFGLVILEAMQASMPVVTSSEGAIPDLVEDGVNGYLMKREDLESFADKIEFLLQKPERIIQMGKAGFERYQEKYRLDIFEQNLLEIIDTITTKDASQSTRA